MKLDAIVVCSLVAYRLTVLLTTDRITRPFRLWLARWLPPRDGEPHVLVVLAGCGRCVGFWLAGATVGVLWPVQAHTGGVPWPVVWLAVAGAVTLLVSVAP